jgi:nitroimidazol reductase NimA-like FMN-containing flavoprotein (pyridoxamine 5'-phosphate oxidase superfamily)
MNTNLTELDRQACLRLLAEGSVGRIAVVLDDGPVILPVNYRLVETASGPLLALRTRPGGIIDQAPTTVAFEIDSIDPAHECGWSVLVRGELIHAEHTSHAFQDRYDPESWLTDRDSWLLIDPFAITGRELPASDPVWPVRPGEYL